MTWEDVFLYGGRPEDEPKPERTVSEPQPGDGSKPHEAARPHVTPAAMMAAGLQRMAEASVLTKKPVWADVPCFSC